MMIFVNAFTNAETIPVAAMRTFLVLLNPFAPHLSSELWERLKSKGDVAEQNWPSHDEKFLIEDEVEIVIQVNGKVRDRMMMSIQASEEEIKSAALALPKIQEIVAGKQIRKVVVIPKKLVNIVVA
jgi:leucyl-tRNA synthetase